MNFFSSVYHQFRLHLIFLYRNQSIVLFKILERTELNIFEFKDMNKITIQNIYIYSFRKIILIIRFDHIAVLYRSSIVQ